MIKRQVSTTIYHKGKHVPVRLDIEIDVDGLARVLGPKALKNKSRTSKLAAGVTVTVSK